MNLKKILTNNKLLVRLIASYLITSILLTGVLMGALSSFISTRTELKTTETAQNIMRQSYNTYYYALTDIYGDYYQLWSKDIQMKKALEQTEFSSLDLQVISNSLDNATFRDDFIDSVYIINKEADLVISNNREASSLSAFYDQSGVDLFTDFEKYYETYKDIVFFPRTATYNINNVDNKKNYISIVYASKNKENKLTSGIIVNIDQDKLSSLVSDANENSTMIVINSSGKIISDSKGTGFGKPLPQGEIYNNIANNVEDEDSFVGNYLGEKSFITFKKASNIGFIFISITPYSYISEEVAKVNRVIALFFVISLLISLLVNVFSIKKIYSPLNNLIKDMKDNPSIEKTNGMNEYAFLEEAYDDLVLKNKQSHIARIFNGHHSDNSVEVLGFTKDKFLSFAVMPDDTSLKIPRVLQELIRIVEENTQWLGAIVSSESMGCIINQDDLDDGEMDSIMEQLVNIQEIVLHELDIAISIGVGTVVNSIDSIRYSHRYATIAVQYAQSIGESQVIFYNEIENSKVAASVNKDTIADNMVDYVMANYSRQDFSVDEIAEELDLSLGYIRQIFRSEKDITLNDFIINTRIDKAKQLLLATEDTAKDISEAVGYYDNRYFYTIFKKKVGMTTEEYRKSQKEVAADENQ